MEICLYELQICEEQLAEDSLSKFPILFKLRVILYGKVGILVQPVDRSHLRGQTHMAYSTLHGVMMYEDKSTIFSDWYMYRWKSLVNLKLFQNCCIHPMLFTCFRFSYLFEHEISITVKGLQSKDKLLMSLSLRLMIHADKFRFVTHRTLLKQRNKSQISFTGIWCLIIQFSHCIYDSLTKSLIFWKFYVTPLNMDK